MTLPRRLVVVLAQMDAERHLLHVLGEVEVGRRREHGVAAQDQQQLDPARLHVVDAYACAFGQVAKIQADAIAVAVFERDALRPRRIVPQIGGTFEGPELSGKLVPGVSADWQIVLPDGTAIADLRYTLETDNGALLYVQSRGVRHGTAEVIARLARGEDVDPSEYTFRTSTQIETASKLLDWLNKGVFISVGGRLQGGVIYETYLVA